MPKYRKYLYSEMNSRQKENFNFQKVSGHLADYGFNCLRLSDDWNGADFIACHIDGKTFLKVQLKGRMTIQKRYCGKDIHVAFRGPDHWYLYPHDELMDILTSRNRLVGTTSWDKDGSYSWPSLSKDILEIIAPYAI